MASIAPITCVQFGTNRLIESFVLAGAPEGTKMSNGMTLGERKRIRGVRERLGGAALQEWPKGSPLSS